ncbi:MAG TPA: MFS transporter [Micropepsaceae bacterium]|nr:MFS transporter [Micropepsaceae bacterium]
MNDASLRALRVEAPARAGFARWAITAILLIAVTTAFFDRINIAVLFTNKDFQSAIGVSDPALLGLLMSAFVFAYGASMMLFSISGDYFGPKRTLSTIAVVLGATMAFMGAVSSYALMFLGRVVIGITEGPQFGTSTATVKRWFPPKERAVGNSVWTIGSPLGSAIGFPLVIMLVAQFGWRASFYVLAVLNAFVVLPIVLLYLKDNPPASDAPEPKPREEMSFVQGFATFASDWRFWCLVVFNTGTLIYLWGLNAWLPTYLQQARHFDIAHAGIYSSLPFILMALGEILCALVGDWTGKRAAVCGVGLFLTGVFLYLAAVVPGAIESAWCIALSAFFWGGTTPTLFTLGTEIIPTKVTAAGFGIYAGIANAISSFAPFVVGALVKSTGDFLAGFEFLVACCVIGSFFMIPLMRRH